MQNRKSNTRLQYESLESKTLLAANLVADINQLSPNSGNPRDIVAVGETAFFVAEDENGSELWKSDSSGTQMVKDIVPGPEGSYPHTLIAGESLLFFSAPGGTWRSDGTEEGTFLIASEQRTFAAVSGDYALLTEPRGFYLNDGTIDGEISVVFDVTNNIDSEAVGAFSDHFVVKFGRAEETLARINFDGSTFLWEGFVERPDYVHAREDGIIVLKTGGGESWILSNDTEDARLVEFEGVTFDNSLFEQSGNISYFTAAVNDSESARKLFRSDGTVEGTFEIGEFGSNQSFEIDKTSRSVAVDGNGGMWFTARATDELGLELWHTDGTPEGTRQVKDISSGGDVGSNPYGLTAIADRVWFVADDDVAGKQVWTSDGTEAGTVALTHFENTTFDPLMIGTSTDHVVFSVGTPELGTELWKASAGSTRLVRDIHPQSGSSLPGFLTSVGDGSFIFAATNQHGRELWKTDLTEAGTVLVKDIVTGPETIGSSPNDIVAFNGNVFFTANDGIHGNELWTMDESGSPKLFKDIVLGPGSSQPNQLTVVGKTLYFAAQDSIHGMALWQSDGTPEGTSLVADSIPGPTGLSPQQFVVAKGELYFLGYGEFDFPPHPSVWKLDGEETVQIYHNDSNRGLGFLTVLNDDVFFLDDVQGRTPFPRRINDLGNVETVNGFEDLFLSVGGLPQMAVVANQLVSSDRNGAWFSDGESGPNRFNTFQGSFYGQMHFTEDYVVVRNSPGNFYVGDPTTGQMVLVSNDITDIVGFANTHLTFTEQQLFVGDPLALPDQPLMTFHRIMPNPIEFEGRIYFAAESENGKADIWSSDGTADGTTQITDVGFSTGKAPIALHAIGSNVYFTADDGTLGEELWKLETPTDTRGDLNGDGAQDAADIDALFASIQTDVDDPEFDVNDDGKVDSQDIDYLLIEVLNRRWGDTNLDGTIGFEDFLVLSQSFGSADAGWSQGDFTGDGEVSFADFLLLSAAFGESIN